LRRTYCRLGKRGEADLSDFLEDYATSRVPEERTIGGFRIGMINGVLCFAVPGLVAGVQIGGAVGLERGIRAFVIGGLFLSVIGTVVGVIGVRNRVSSYVLTKFIFGRAGANFLNLAIAIALLGWYGVNMDLLSATVQQLCEQLFAFRPPAWGIEVISGVLMTVTAIYGFRVLSKVSAIAVPLLVLLTLYIGIKSFLLFDGDFQRVAPGLSSMSDGEAVTAVAGGFIVSAVLMSDFTRFARTDKDAAVASFLPFFALSSVAYLSSAIAAIALQQTDILNMMLVLGLGIGALGLVFVSTWITNVVNLYSCSLSLSSVFEKQKNWHLTVIAGLLATVAAMMNILDNYTTFLFGLSAIFAPIGGIFITEFYLFRSMRRYRLRKLDSQKALGIVALASWAIGTTAAFLSTYGIFTITGIEVADAILVASVAYTVLAWPPKPRISPDADTGVE